MWVVLKKNWQDATQAVVNEAKKTVLGMKGLEIKNETAKVDPNMGKMLISSLHETSIWHITVIGNNNRRSLFYSTWINH